MALEWDDMENKHEQLDEITLHDIRVCDNDVEHIKTCIERCRFFDDVVEGVALSPQGEPEAEEEQHEEQEEQHDEPMETAEVNGNHEPSAEYKAALHLFMFEGACF